MAKFRNITDDSLDLKFLPGGPVVAPDAVFDVDDALVLEEGHRCESTPELAHVDHSADARVFPSTLFARVGGTSNPEPAPPAPPAEPFAAEQ